MSWKRQGTLISGPPTNSNTNKLDPRFRPNLGGRTAFQREQELARYGGHEYTPEGKTEWDVLKDHHRFIRDDEEPTDVSWEERLARAYESKLFKEFALIDLKHFKSRRLALRWRTAPEVVDGIGEDTCGSLRCKYHTPGSAPEAVQWASDTPGPSISERGTPHRKRPTPPLRSFELPFVYSEGGERKEALVKVRLCRRCEGKLTWKPGKDDVGSEDDASAGNEEDEEEAERSRVRERGSQRRKEGGSVLEDDGLSRRRTGKQRDEDKEKGKDEEMQRSSSRPRINRERHRSRRYGGADGHLDADVRHREMEKEGSRQRHDPKTDRHSRSRSRSPRR